MQSAATGEPADWPGSGVSVTPRPPSGSLSAAVHEGTGERPAAVSWRCDTKEGSNGAVPEERIPSTAEREEQQEGKEGGAGRRRRETDTERRNDRPEKWKESKQSRANIERERKR